MGYPSNSSLSWDRRVTGYVVKDKTGEIFRLGSFSNIYISKAETNCWQVAAVNQYGQGPWSNEVCYSPPLPSKPTLYMYASLGEVSGFFQQPTAGPRIQHILIRDNSGVTQQQAGFDIRIRFPKTQSNCWEAATVSSIGQSDWSNKVCYTLQVPSRAPQVSGQPAVSCSNSVVLIRLSYVYLGLDVVDDLFISGGPGFEYSFTKDALNLSISGIDCSVPRSFTAAYRNSSGTGPVTSLGAFSSVSPAVHQAPAGSDGLSSPPSARVGALCVDSSVVAQTGPKACSKRGGRVAWIIPDGIGSWRTSDPSDCVGICYGVPSKINGLPRNNYVSGYFRSDGTYVKPYTRSK